MAKGKIITIDGPAGAGKTSSAKTLAKTIKGAYLDTGAVYRAMACVLDKNGFKKDDIIARHDEYEALFREIPVSAYYVNDTEGAKQYMRIGAIPIPDPTLRTPLISELSSVIAVVPEIRTIAREIITNCTRDLDIPVVAEGRDTGTALFPDAMLKFYLWAPLEARAIRRLKQLGKPLGPAIGEEREALAKRDARDSGRDADPLSFAADAIWIDNGNLTQAECDALLAGIARARLNPSTVRLI